jgi:uncharacterized cysteine cluster protein YcgN (CxxCxxCC family)
MANREKPFWKVKKMAEMTRAEWESLCDGCARCCLEKLLDEETGLTAFTSVTCSFLDTWTCRCTAYTDRITQVPECIIMTPGMLDSIKWLPVTCAYRRIHEGGDLEWWHPLVSGNRDTVHEAGISVRDKAISGRHVLSDQLAAYIIDAKL